MACKIDGVCRLSSLLSYIANGYSTRLDFGYPLVSYVNFQLSVVGVPPFVTIFSVRPQGVLVSLFL